MKPQDPGTQKRKAPTLRRLLRNRWFLACVAALLLYTVIGFFLAPYLVTRAVPWVAEKQLKRQARVGTVRINPFLLTFEARDFLLSEPDGQPMAGFGRLFFDFELSGIFRWAWTLRELHLDNPLVNAVMGEDGVLNFARLGPDAPSEPDPDPDAEPTRMLLQNIGITQGEIHFTDRRQSVPAKLSVRPLNIELKDISTLPDRRGPYSLAAHLGDGGLIRWSGDIELNPFRSRGDLSFEDIPVTTLWEFVRDSLKIAPPDGLIGIQGTYALDLSATSPQFTLEGLGCRLAGLELGLDGEGGRLLDLKEVRVDDTRFDLGSQSLEIGKLAFSSGSARIAVDPEGTLNLLRVLRNGPAGAEPVEEPRNGLQEETPDDQGRGWDIGAAAVEIDGIAISYLDRSRTPEFSAEIGSIGVNGTLAARFGAEEPSVRLKGLSSLLEDLRMSEADAAAPPIEVERIVLENGAFDLGQQTFTASRIGLEGGDIEVSRNKTGEINLAVLFSPPEAPAVQAEAVETGSPWKFSVQAIDLSNFATAFSDQTVKAQGPVVHLDPWSVQLRDVDGVSPSAFHVECAVEQGGKVALQGTVDPGKGSVESHVEVKDLALTPAQPYLGQVAALTLRSGTASTRGRLLYGMNAAGAGLVYDGDLKLAGLKITEPDKDETFFGWHALNAAALKFRLDPGLIEIPEIELVKPAGKLVIAEDGSVNVVKVMKTRSDVVETAASGAKEENSESFPVRIRRLLVKGGDVFFADLSLMPRFATRIQQLQGAVVGISSARNSRAQVDLRGQVDKYGTVAINGEIDTFDAKAFTDISMIFENVEMTTLSPYSGKFAGRRIDSGKLSLDLDYQIENAQMLGENQIVVESLELGERVESPQAVNLPLDLAVALLEDSRGVIDIGLPVKGDLGDPQFSFGHLIGKALMNFIMKIVSSPFRVLGALLGSDSEGLDAVAFEPGQAAVPPPEAEKLHRLAQALLKRPNLRLEVQGRYSPSADGSALRALALRRALAAQLGAKLEPEEDPGPVDYGNPDTEKALDAIFRERLGKPALKKFKASLESDGGKEETRDPGRVSKALFARLAEAEPLPETALPELAQARTRAIVENMTGQDGITVDRLVVKAPEAVGEGGPVTARLILGVAGKAS